MSIELKKRVDEGMINVPGGEIELRDDRIKKKWIVTIDPFQLSKFTVTQDSYFAVMKKSPSHSKEQETQLRIFHGMRRWIFVISYLKKKVCQNTMS